MIHAIVLAAGQSRRMGQPKMLLPWGNTTVLGHVLEVLRRAEVQDALVVTGGARTDVEMIASKYGVRTIHNERFADEEMLSSIQFGLRGLSPLPAGEGQGEGLLEGALICLGDQPQIQEGTVRLVCEAFTATKSSLVVPSYQLRRGHPWLVAQRLWDQLSAMTPPRTPRDFLNQHAGDIHYVAVNTATVIEDLDTPEDYLKFRP